MPGNLFLKTIFFASFKKISNLIFEPFWLIKLATQKVNCSKVWKPHLHILFFIGVKLNFDCAVFCKLVSVVKCQVTFHLLQQEEPEEDFGTGYCSKTQKHLWNLFENPHHSCAAKVNKNFKMRKKKILKKCSQVIAVVSCLFVVVSTLCLIFSTLPRFQKKDKNGVIRKFAQMIQHYLCVHFFFF